jgi:serine/threonine protein kinase
MANGSYEILPKESPDVAEHASMLATRVVTHLGRYEIDGEIGRGAMGVVYRAQDPSIERRVAIKAVSLGGLTPYEEKEYRQRFIVEARAAGRLSHPGIVGIFDVGAEAETRTPYLVMEYIEGQALDQLLSGENTRLPLTTALQLTQEVAEALHHAHSQGVVHRDIKPGNILVTTDGHAKITDFGVAKLDQAVLTLPGRLVGSPAYMAPEQLSHDVVDARSDLFSLGAVLYCMVTGHRPFQGSSVVTVCFKVVHREPLAITTFDAELPPELERIISRAIAKDPARRYQSGMEMASDIERLREECGLVHPNVTSPAQSLKWDAIPRYISGGAEPPSAQGGTAKLGSELPELRSALRPGGSWLPWSCVLALTLLASVMGFLALSNMHDNKPQGNGLIQTEPAARHSSTGDVAVRGSNEQITKAVASASRAKIPVSRVNATTPRPKASMPGVPANAILQIEFQHHFADALASIWLDNSLVYSHSLQGESKTRAIVFRKVEGHEFEAIAVPAGEHILRVRIQSAADAYDQSKTIPDAFIRSSESRLRIVCGKKPGQLQLILQ